MGAAAQCVLLPISVATPAHASDTYTRQGSCAEYKTPRLYTALAAANGKDYVRHIWTGAGGTVTYGYSATRVSNFASSYRRGRVGTATAQTKTTGVFLDGSATMTCVSQPV